MEGKKVKSVCTTCRGKGCDKCDGDGYIFVKAITSSEEPVSAPMSKGLSFYNASLKRRYLDEIIKAVKKFQSKYFENNEDAKYLKPMLLRDITKITGLNISIVCRALQGEKINDTLIKDLFGKEVDGNSNRVICNVIREIVKSESMFNPLSDAMIQRELTKRGYEIARRTVSKYRKSIGIANTTGRGIDLTSA